MGDKERAMNSLTFWPLYLLGSALIFSMIVELDRKELSDENLP